MRTPEEIKKAMQRHLEEDCGHCPYYFENPCMPSLLADVRAYVEQLEEENMCMKIQMHGDCGVCKHRHYAQVRQDGPHFSGPCHSCIQKETRPNWEYEGLPEVKSK